MFLNGTRWMVSLLSSVCKSRLLCPRGCCAAEVRGHERPPLPLSSFQSHPPFSKSVSCSKAKRSFVTVWPGSPWMKTSNQALIVTNYIRLYLCNLHCSNLIQAVLKSWKSGEAKEFPSMRGEVCRRPELPHWLHPAPPPWLDHERPLIPKRLCAVIQHCLRLW